MSSASERTGRAPNAPHACADARLNGISILIYILLALIALRLVYLQLVARDHYLRVSDIIEQGPKSGAPVRGSILARDMSSLAESVEVFSVCADPSALVAGEGRRDRVDEAASKLASELDLDADALAKVLRDKAAKGSEYYPVKRLLPKDQADRLQALDLDGVWLKSEWQRVHNRGTFACHILGRCSDHHEPLEGIEKRWDFVLAGRPGTPRADLDAFGRRILGRDSSGVLPAQPGSDLVLTIDPKLQEAAEMALDDCMKRFAPDTATCVVLDPNTGEILASASVPSYHPEHVTAENPEELRMMLDNVPVTRAYEPGSIFKVLLAAAVVETGACSPNKTFYCGGVTQLGGSPLRCWGRWQFNGGHKSCNLTRMLAQSCNIAAANFALEVGADRLWAFLKSVGIGDYSRAGMPVEVRGSILNPADMSARDVASIGFGQGLRVNDIQLASAIGAVVNGGRFVQPHIIKAVLDPETGEAQREVKPVELGAVCSPETSAEVRRMMGEVVTHGTGANAFISDDVAVGGKTGTAQRWDARNNRYMVGRNIVSFVLVAPLDNPRFVVLVTADAPRRGQHGSDVAAPTARTVAIAALREADLLPAATEIKVDTGLRTDS